MTMFYENRLGYQLATRANASVGLDEENSFNDITYWHVYVLVTQR